MPRYYQKHIFFCNNLKDSGKKCCSLGGADKAKDWAKEYLVSKSVWGPGKIRVSSSGCMGRCSLGPVMVVYPEGCWYKYTCKDDIETIIEHHLNSSEPLISLSIQGKEV